MEEWNDNSKLILTSVALCSCCGMFGIAIGAFLFFADICDSLGIHFLCETDCVSNCTQTGFQTLNNSIHNTTDNITWNNESNVLNLTTDLATNLTTNSSVNVTIPSILLNSTSVFSKSNYIYTRR